VLTRPLFILLSTYAHLGGTQAFGYDGTSQLIAEIRSGGNLLRRRRDRSHREGSLTTFLKP